MPSVSHTLRFDTLRSRLAAWHLAILTVTLGVFAASCYVILTQSLYQHHDEELEQQAREVIEVLAATALNQSAIEQALGGAPTSSRFVMIRDERGDLVYRDASLASSEPNIGRESALVHAAQIGVHSPAFFTIDLQQSTAVRFICVPLSQAGFYLQIGDPLGDVRATLRGVLMRCLPLFPAALFLSSFGGWVIAKRGLAPMRSVTETLRDIQATDLTRRVDVNPTDQELGALVRTLNELLDRLQRAFESLRQFAGDVSHQIQTPLTVIKGDIETALRDPSRAGERAWLHGLTDEVEGMRATVVALQALALADAPIQDAASVDLSEAVNEACDIVSALGELRHVAVTCHVEPGIRTRGDATRLKQVVLNLGDNAVKYTVAGGEVTIRLESSHDGVTLRVEDTGIGISEQDVPRLFDRLFRADGGRGGVDGTGLGLAIVKRIVTVHGGTVQVASTPGVGSIFTVRLPGAPAQPDPPVAV